MATLPGWWLAMWHEVLKCRKNVAKCVAVSKKMPNFAAVF